jgi:RNA polymerase sigma factor (sigma-70 family)
MSEVAHESAETAAPAPFGELWDALRAGESAEYRRLVSDCTPFLLRVVRKRLDRRLRGRFDSIDFTQAVWASFVAQMDALPAFATVDELRAYLAQMATNKVIDEARRQTRGSEPSPEVPAALPGDVLAAEVPGHQATPSQFAMANERMEQLTAGRSHEHRRIIELKFYGETVPGIAEAVGLSQRQVRRVLVELEEELTRSNVRPQR